MTPSRIRRWALALCVLGLGSTAALAQTEPATAPPAASTAATGKPGKVAGTVTAKDGSTMPGVTVQDTTTGNGAVSDIDGHYLIENIAPGFVNLRFTYLGYATQRFSGVPVGPDSITNLSLTLLTTAESGKTLETFVVTGFVDRGGVTELSRLQQNSPTVLDGISRESITRSPDRNTGDVLKRVSGASIQGNKFVIVRGLADRYNLATVNGVILPSTEADRRSFSFDIFPASLLDNLTIVKTASPDQPGEFAGGIIQIKTRDVPEENSLTVQVGASYNSQTTFKERFYQQGGKTDWLGYDDGTRLLPKDFPARSVLINLPPEEQARYGRMLPNTWEVKRQPSASPNPSLQIAYAHRFKINKRQAIGLLAAVNYTHQFKMSRVEREVFDIPEPAVVLRYRYLDSSWTRGVSTGGVVNLSYQLNENNRITVKSFLSMIGEDQFVKRQGLDSSGLGRIRATSSWWTQNRLGVVQVNGDHFLPASKIRINYGLSYGDTRRDIPDLRRDFITSNIDTNFDGFTDTGFVSFVPPSTPSPTFAGRFFSTTNENTWTAKADVTLPFRVLGTDQSLKLGGMLLTRDRAFETHLLSYTAPNQAFRDSFLVPGRRPEEIFALENVRPDGLRIRDISNNFDNYLASSEILAGYLMFDNKVFERLRVVWGLRLETFHQYLITEGYTGGEPLIIDTNYVDPLPSINLIYSLNEKSNIRLSGSRTLSRPEFREIAPFSFYDFNLNVNVDGQPNLVRSQILNGDLRYERFFRGGQSASITAFYKQFTNPIEQVIRGNSTLTFANIPEATALGLEAEVRSKLSILDTLTGWRQFSNLTFYANASIIRSQINSGYSFDTVGSTRLMQGQSPYIINAGLQYSHPSTGLGFNILFNRFGRRIFQVGDFAQTTIWEAPRSVLDLQISKRVFRKRTTNGNPGEHQGEFRLTFGDILNQPNTFYQDSRGRTGNGLDAKYSYVESNGRYNKDHVVDGETTYLKDITIQQFRYGFNASLTFNYRF